MSQSTILVNGKLYDTKTGLPVEITAAVEPEVIQPAASRRPSPSHVVHRQNDMPRTTNRRASVISQSSRPESASQVVAQKSASISKFAPHPVQPTKPSQVFTDIRPATSHALVQKAHVKLAPAPRPAQPTPKPADIIKKEAIDEAMDKAPRLSATAPTQK